MDDAISRSAVLDRLEILRRNYTLKAGYRDAITDAIGEVRDAITLDAVPVVRCKDCEHWERDWLCSSGNLKEHFCPMIGCTTDHEFYCKHGARMDGDAE